MQEIELKFQVPDASLDALAAELRALPGGGRPAQRLQAAYFDTLDRRLARARAALRVRQEDDDWVQTLKAAGANAMTRLEDNQALPGFGPGEAIQPDLARHVDAHVREALMRDLGWRPEADPHGHHVGLLQLYRTDMHRLRASLDTPAATTARVHRGRVEIALDLGEITSGPLRRRVQEVEIELVDGDPRAVISVARELVRRHGLWLDTQTKAHRGDQLAREAAASCPSPMPAARVHARIKAGHSGADMWRAGIDAALEQVGACLSEVALHEVPPAARANTAAIGSITTDGAPNTAPAIDLQSWIRGWAVGLRRLRRLWQSVPSELRQSSVCSRTPAQIAAEIARQYAALRPGPGACLHGDAAGLLARSAAPTLLALDLLEANLPPAVCRVV